MVVGDTIYRDKLKKVSHAPGYRNIRFTVEVNHGNGRYKEMELELSKEDAMWLLKELVRSVGVSMSDPENPFPIDWDEEKDTMGILETFCKENWKNVRIYP